MSRVVGSELGIVQAIDPTEAAKQALAVGARFGRVVLGPCGADDRARATAIKAQCKNSALALSLASGRWHLGAYHLDVPNGGVTIAAPKSLATICFIGDSMVEGISGVGTGTGPRAELWTALEAAIGRVSFVGTSFDVPLSPASGTYDLGEYWTEGYGGYTVQAIQKSCVAGVAAAKPTIGVIVCGTNNVTLALDAFGSATTVLARIGQLIDACKVASPDTVWLVSTLCPYNVAGGSLATIQARIAAVNAALPALCAEHGVCCVDAWGSLSVAQLHTDNIHPAAAGNTQVATILGDAITMLLQPSATLAPRAFASRSSNCLTPADYNHAIGSIAYDADQQIGTHSFAMAIWFRVTDLHPAGGGAMTYTIVRHGETAATNVVIYHSSAGSLDIYVGASHLMTWPGQIAINTWYRFVLYGNAVDGKFEAWLNGKYLGKSSALTGYNLADTGTTQLGRGVDLGYGYGMVGQVADFVLCRDDAADWRAPNMRDIEADYYDGLLLPGAKGYWSMSEGSGAGFADSFAACGAGTVVGTWATQARP